MERRVLLAVVLSFLVLILYQQWLGPPPVPTDQQMSENEVGTTAESENLARPQGVLEPAAATVGQPHPGQGSCHRD